MVTVRLSPSTEMDKTIITDCKLKATTVEESDTKQVTKDLREMKPKATGPGMGSEMKELTIESLWQGLRLKKDIQLGKISEPTWKEQKHTVSKVTQQTDRINIRLVNINTYINKC